MHATHARTFFRDDFVGENKGSKIQLPKLTSNLTKRYEPVFTARRGRQSRFGWLHINA